MCQYFRCKNLARKNYQNSLEPDETLFLTELNQTKSTWCAWIKAWLLLRFTNNVKVTEVIFLWFHWLFLSLWGTFSVVNSKWLIHQIYGRNHPENTTQQKTFVSATKLNNHVSQLVEAFSLIYSPSPKIDTPKIDTFYENSRIFWNSKILGEGLSKSPIFGQNHKNDGVFSDFNIWWASSSKIRAYLVKYPFYKVHEI